MQAHAPGARLPLRTSAVAAQSGKLLPAVRAVSRAEQSGIFYTGVNRVRIGERRLKMPDPLELPRVLGAVIELMRGEGFAGLRRGVVGEFVARASLHGLRAGLYVTSRRLPGLAAVVRPLDHLPEPAAG